MPDILSTLLGGAGNQGLLSPEQQGDVTGQGLMSMGAAMLKAAGPSPYKAKMTTLSGLGEGIQAGIAGRNTATSNALQQTLVRSKTLESLAPFLKMQQEAAEAGIPLHPDQRRVLDALLSTSGIRSPVPGGVGTGVPLAGAGGIAAPAGWKPPSATPGALPPTNALQKFADEHNYPRSALIPGHSANASLMKDFEETQHALNPAISESEFNKKVMEEKVARDAKMYPAIVEMGHQAQTMKENADLSVALMKNKNFFSGIGANLVEPWKQFAAKFGEDPNAANPMQVYNKITNANVNDQIGAMRTAAASMGPGIGRVFQLQAELMQKASQSLKNEPGANLVLANMQQRAAANMQAITDMAFRHKKEHKILGVEFDEEASKYLAGHPVLTPAELKNITQSGTVEGVPAPTAVPVPGAVPGAPNGPAPIPGAIGPAGGAGQAVQVPQAVGPGGHTIRFIDGKWQ